MKIVYFVVGGILVLAAALAPLAIGIFADDPSAGAIARMQAIFVAYTSIFSCVGAILFIALIGVLALLVFQLQNNIVPLLEKVTDTMQTIKGTTAFVSESVVQPIIKTAGAVAGARAAVQTLMRRSAGTETTHSNGNGNGSKPK
jgi:hypothetical protein